MAIRTSALADRLARATASCGDLESLAGAVFDTVGGFVRFAFGCLATTDPASQVITRAIKSDPLPIGDEEFAAAEYGGPDLNLFAEIALRPLPVGALSVDTDGHPERCLRLRTFMTPRFGFTDEIRVVCRSRSMVWGALAIYRKGDEPPFTQEEAELLGSVHELLAERLQQVLFDRTEVSTSSTGGTAVLIVDAADRVTELTAMCRDRIEDLGGWDNDSLPSSVLAVIARARARGQSARTRVPGRCGQWFALQAMVLDGPDATRSVVVTIDEAPPASVAEMKLAARGLTDREQDVVRLVLRGASTKVIAATLHLSPHTVQDHLKSIFSKLEVTSRRELIAQLVLPR